MPNTTATHVLNAYLALPDPRYALLVTAPWGAGKTEFIRQHTGYERDREALYLSLFGIDSAEAFNAALLAALLNSPGKEVRKKLTRWGENAKNVLSGSRIMGVSLNLTSLSLVEGLRDDLPGTLVFDDLERCGMEDNVMFGLLNKFIEHDRRRVILIANTDQMDKKQSFDTTREKLIGQTIRIEPDFDAALQSYWASIPQGHGKKYLQAEQALIRQVFTEGAHGNLRLLRHALQAATSLLDKIDPDLFAFEQPMKRLTGTFLALHMAYTGGKIGEAELAKRGDWTAFGKGMSGKPKPDELIEPLKALADDHPDFDIEATDAPVLPMDLTDALLIKGYASPASINARLRQIHHFQPPEDQPDWIRLMNWRNLPVDELRSLLDHSNTRLAANEVTDPVEFIALFIAMDLLAEHEGIGRTQPELIETFLSHIANLKNANLMQARLPSAQGAKSYQTV